MCIRDSYQALLQHNRNFTLPLFARGYWDIDLSRFPNCVSNVQVCLLYTSLSVAATLIPVTTGIGFYIVAALIAFFLAFLLWSVGSLAVSGGRPSREDTIKKAYRQIKETLTHCVGIAYHTMCIRDSHRFD